MTSAPWPANIITREALAAALLAIGEPQAVADQFGPAALPLAQGADQHSARDDLLQAASSPERRASLAGPLGCAYADLTNWVIRADLMRVDGLSAGAARALAGAGVVGVHDLAAWAAEPRRRDQLLADLPALAPTLSAADLDRWGQQAAGLDSRVIADTAVVVVVKGAGVQKPDETLDVFLNGFWPALKVLDPQASMTQRQDIFPPGFRSSPHDEDPHNHVTEIRSGERRLWVKEINWGVELKLPNPFQALSLEWHMASYAFGSTIYDLLSPDTRRRGRTVVSYYLPFAAMYFMLVAPSLLAFLVNSSTASPLLGYKLLTFGALVSTALLAALPPALIIARQMRAHLEQQQPLAVLPGMAHWVFILLLAAILFDPGRYFLFLLVLALIQLALLRARAMAWPYRQIANSDTTTTNYHAARDAQGEMKIVRRDRQSVIFWQIFYRYLVVLGLPITFVALMAARLLRWTRVLEQVGITLEKSLSVILSGFLGDVVTYASDPAQAHRIQSVVETDIKFFLDRPEVSGLHVFAHSLGTPITFETIFQNLADQYRARIHTYVTIGSVLSYFNQVNPVMDPLYLPRFPVRPYPSFNPRFKWMNFWNLADPITEFYGLDEYNLLLQAPDLVAQPGGPPTRVQRDPASPTNIKTRATLQNHSEYWSNLDLVCKPFARRVLGDLRPPEWAPADVPAQPLPWLVGALARLFNLPFHFLYVYSWWAIWLIIFLAPLILLPWLWSQPPVQVFLAQIAQAVSGALLPLGGEAARLFPKQAEAFGEFNTTVLNGLTLLESTATHQLTEALALLVNLLVLALALFNWIVQSIRAPKSAPTLE